MHVSGKNGYLLKHPAGDFLSIHAAYNLFDSSTFVNCCGGKCGCKCNDRPAAWTVEFYDCFGAVACLEGLTYVIDYGLDVLGDPYLCGGSNMSICGDIYWLAIDVNNGAIPPSFPTRTWLTLRVNVAGFGDINIVSYYENGGEIVPGYQMGDCYTAGEVTGLSNVFGTHGFSATVTPE